MANAHALTKFFPQKGKWDKWVQSLVKDFMDHQPSGYRAYGNFSGHAFNKGKRELATLIASAGSPNSISPKPAAPLELLIDSKSSRFHVRDVPIYIVHDTLLKRAPTRLISKKAKFDQSPALFDGEAYYRA
jgi:hypothetical protein